MKTLLRLIFFPAAFLMTSCDTAPVDLKDDQPTDEAKHETITLGGGCYWCVEAVFQQLDGVISATSGFMGGHVPNPSYEDVCAGFTGHVEVVQVVYDPEVISTDEILSWFWKSHDPTDPLGQGNDQGPMYLSHIFAHSEEQLKTAELSLAAAQQSFQAPIVTKIREASEFYQAPEKHQDYYENNKNQNPYCPAVITPKLKKLNLDY